MNGSSKPTIFFDGFSTVGAMRMSATGGEIEEFTVFRRAVPIVKDLHLAGARLGLLSHGTMTTGHGVRAARGLTGVVPGLDDALVLNGPRGSPLLFEHAAAVAREFRAGLAASDGDLLYVSGDAVSRVQARAAGFLTAPGLALIGPALERKPLRYLRIRIPDAVTPREWAAELRNRPLIPLHFSGDSSRGQEVYAIADLTTAAELDDLGFWVDRLGADDEPQSTDAYLLGNDRRVEEFFPPPPDDVHSCSPSPEAASRVLASTPEGLFVSIPAGRSVESYCFSASREDVGVKLLPSLTLLEQADPTDCPPREVVDCTPSAEPPELEPGVRQVLEDHIDSQCLHDYVKRYSGEVPVSGSTLILSRHVDHEHNLVAVDELVKDLEKIDGLRVSRHRFPYKGRCLDNIEATLRGSNRGGIVIISAHLDSTGHKKKENDYQGWRDEARGADDDASGVAGVLCAARALTALAVANPARDRHEIRFVLFNAEEDKLIGSGAYASDQANACAPIVAVFQMDMIGHDVRKPPTFELHAGCLDAPQAEMCSRRLSLRVSHLVPQVVDDRLKAQQYPPQRIMRDPAQHRSDHHSFHLHGYAACLISEDFFPGPEGVRSERNPKYHHPDDAVINPGYAADITRVVAAAAWVTATTDV
jgi:hypothetical protein